MRYKQKLCVHGEQYMTENAFLGRTREFMRGEGGPRRTRLEARKALDGHPAPEFLGSQRFIFGCVGDSWIGAADQALRS